MGIRMYKKILKLVFLLKITFLLIVFSAKFTFASTVLAANTLNGTIYLFLSDGRFVSYKLNGSLNGITDIHVLK